MPPEKTRDINRVSGYRDFVFYWEDFNPSTGIEFVSQTKTVRMFCHW